MARHGDRSRRQKIVARRSGGAYSPGVNPVSTRRRLMADASLLAVAVVWGATFPLTKYILEFLPPFLYLSVRFALAAALLIPLALGGLRALPLALLFRGLGVGAVLGAAYALQTIGLQSTTATIAAFITGLSVVLVPVFGSFVGRGSSRRVWFGVGLATLGLALLTLQPGSGSGSGDLLILFCAVLLAIQILMVDRVATRITPIAFGALQSAGVALLCILFVPLERAPLPAPAAVWIAVIAMAILASALAFTVQSWAQRFTLPSHVGLIFAAEPISAGVFARVFLGEALDTRQWLGAVMILAGILLAEMRPRRVARKASPVAQQSSTDGS